jgi:TonB family protein
MMRGAEHPFVGQDHGSRWAGWAVIAACAHIALLLFVIGYAIVFPEPARPPASKVRQVGLVKVPKGQLTAWRTPTNAAPQTESAQARAERERQKQEQQPPKPEEHVDLKKLQGQIVDVPPSPDSNPPDDARFLSSYNTRTERETRARTTEQNYKNAANERTRAGVDSQLRGSQTAQAINVGAQMPQQQQQPQPSGEQSETEAQKLRTIVELPDIPQQERLTLAMNPAQGRYTNRTYSEALRGNSDHLRLQLGGGQGDRESKGPGAGAPNGSSTLQLYPSDAVLGRIAGAPSNDYLPEDLPEGDGTFLNSREFRYASFFNRLKQGVSEQWHPLDIMRYRDPTGNVYGLKNRVTVVKVVLDKNGQLLDLQVMRQSGIPALDSEAVEAFKRAQPFPNPPAALLDGAGRIEFPFGFYIVNERFPLIQGLF